MELTFGSFNLQLSYNLQFTNLEFWDSSLLKELDSSSKLMWINNSHGTQAYKVERTNLKKKKKANQTKNKEESRRTKKKAQESIKQRRKIQ